MRKSGSKHILNRSGLSGQPCLTPFLQLISSVVPFLVSILVVALVYIVTTIDCMIFGILRSLMTLYMNACGIDPNALVQSMVTASRSVPRLRASAMSSLTRMLCSEHPLHFSMNPFCVLEKKWC